MTTEYEIGAELAARLDKDFTYHAPHGDQAYRYERIRFKLGSLAAYLHTRCPPSRELSIAITKLEEAMFWANAAIARNESPPASDDELPTGWGPPD